MRCCISCYLLQREALRLCCTLHLYLWAKLLFAAVNFERWEVQFLTRWSSFHFLVYFTSHAVEPCAPLFWQIVGYVKKFAWLVQTIRVWLIQKCTLSHTEKNFCLEVYRYLPEYIFFEELAETQLEVCFGRMGGSFFYCSSLKQRNRNNQKWFQNHEILQVWFLLCIKVWV